MANVADWGGGMSAGYRPQVQLFTGMRIMDGRILCCGIISSCQSLATSETVKNVPGRKSDLYSKRHIRYHT